MILHKCLLILTPKDIIPANETPLAQIKENKMKKILYNRPLFNIVTVIVLATLILGSLEYIDVGLLIIPIVLPYLIWLFKLMRSEN